MSYELLIFELQAAPSRRSDLLTWCSQQTQSVVGDAAGDRTMLAAGLRAWLAGMTSIFPPISDAGSSLNIGRRYGPTYRPGRSIICAAFDWCDSTAAFATARVLAEQHHVGLIEVGHEATEIWLPRARSGCC